MARGPFAAGGRLPAQQIAALRTASDPEGRYRAKWQLVRNLYNVGYNADELREVFRLIDWMMHLREDLSRKLHVNLADLEESLSMPYVTSIERIAEERGEARGEVRGEARGEVKGGASVLLKQLAKRHGPLADDVEQRVRRLALRDLEALAEAVLDFCSAEDLRAWLDAHAAPVP